MFSPKGEKRVANVIEKFTSLVEELDLGVTELQVELSKNVDTINCLQTRNSIITSSVNRAKGVAAKLKELVS